MDREFHEAANIFPLDEENLGDLAEDIRKNGLQVPIETLGGKIIDGRRRHLACQKARVQPVYREVKPSDPVAYVLSLNLHRRHLSPTQLAMVGAKARKWYDEAAKKRQQESASRAGKASGASRRGETNVPVKVPEGSNGDARDQLGKVIGVSGSYIDKARRVINNGTPKLIAAVEADKIAISTAAQATLLSEEEQDTVAERVASVPEKGKRRRVVPEQEQTEEQEEEQEEERKIVGVGVIRAHEAINCLMRIPKNDALRKRGFQIVTDWIRRSK